MHRHRKLIAAAAYDLHGDDVAGRAGCHYVAIELGDFWHRTILHAAILDDAPAVLARAVSAALDVLRGAWIAMLREEDAHAQRQADAIHAALQHDVARVAAAWSRGAIDAAPLAERLSERRDARRASLARRPPYGPGMIVPERARATEPPPTPLADALDDALLACGALDALRAAAIDDEARRTLGELRRHVDRARVETVGAWRLGEIDAALAATRIGALVSLARDHGARARPDEAPPSGLRVPTTAASATRVRDAS